MAGQAADYRITRTSGDLALHVDVLYGVRSHQYSGQTTCHVSTGDVDIGETDIPYVAGLPIRLSEQADRCVGTVDEEMRDRMAHAVEATNELGSAARADRREASAAVPCRGVGRVDVANQDVVPVQGAVGALQAGESGDQVGIAGSAGPGVWCRIARAVRRLRSRDGSQGEEAARE